MVKSGGNISLYAVNLFRIQECVKDRRNECSAVLPKVNKADVSVDQRHSYILEKDEMQPGTPPEHSQHCLTTR